MERLSGLDASFLYNETPSGHMHTLKLAVLDPPSGEALPLNLLREHVGRQMAAWPAFGRRIVRVPLDLYHPLWVDAGPLDLSYHVRRTDIPAPGTRREMDRLVARLAESPLDRDRPLWQAWLLEGRADGRIAVLIKVHHAVADGVAANALLASILTTDPNAALSDPPPMPPAEKEPSRLRLVLGALAALLTDLRRLPGVLRDTRARVARRRRELASLRAGDGIEPPRPVLDTPVTSLNRAISSRRTIATAKLPLEPLLEAKRAAGVTLNDVLLTVVGGALTTVLADRGEYPSRSLSAGVPVSSDPPPEPGRDPRLTGNKVSNLFVSLCTDVVDPAERVRAVHRSTTAAKRLHEALGSDLMETWMTYAPPRPYSWFVRLYSDLSVADHHRAPFNVVVSNVIGPRQKLYVEGAELVEFFSSGPVLEGIGVNVTAWSYRGDLDVMVTSCARALADLEPLTAAMVEQVDRLRESLGCCDQDHSSAGFDET